MNLFKLIVCVGLLAFFSTNSFAVSDEFSYNFYDLRVQVGTVEDEDGVGLQAAGSIAVTDDIFVLGAYQYLTGTDVDVWVDNLLIAGGYHMPLDDQTDLVLTAGILNQWLETNFFDDSDTGIRLTGGVRYRLEPEIEIQGELMYVSIFDNDDLGVSVSGLVAPSSNYQKSRHTLIHPGFLSLVPAYIGRLRLTEYRYHCH